MSRRRSIALKSLLALTVGCAMPMAARSPASAATLRGKVTDTDGRPIAAAFISVSDHEGHALASTRSAPDGTYQLNIDVAGPYSIWAGKSDPYLHRYMPEIRPASGEINDFRLRPGANIVFAAYDADGKRLNNGQFRRVVGARIFASDLANVPAASNFGVVHNAHSNWQWEKGWPAVIVEPGKRYKLLVQWELAEVGKLLFMLDNAGSGYTVAKPGGEIELGLDREIARSVLAGLLRDQKGDVSGIEAESARELKAGEAALHANPPDTAAAVRHFALSAKSSLAARERIVTERAEADIERYRKGDADVTVVDDNGNPVVGATVGFQQSENDFRFGANPLGPNGSYNPDLAALMHRAGINQSYVTARWGRLELHPGEFDWSNIDNYQKIADQAKSGFGLLGALSLWFTPNPDFSPRFLKQAGFAGLKEAVDRYGHRLAQRYAGRIDIWELNELNLNEANFFNLDWSQRLDIGRTFARAVKEANPQARVMSGSLALPYDAPGSRSLTELLDAGLPADIVGIELYQAGVNTDGTGMVGLDLVRINRLIDQYAALGKPIFVKEFSVPSAQVPGSSWWHGPWDPELQAKFAADVYTIAFSKKSMQGITWSWGVSDSDAFVLHGGLIDAQAKPKPAYFALQRLLASWRTAGSATTNAAGKASWRGFAGNYRVTVTKAGAELLQGTIHVMEQRRSHVVLRGAHDSALPPFKLSDAASEDSAF